MDTILVDALGPLANLYGNADVMEIFVDAPNKIYFDRRGEIFDAKESFKDQKHLLETIKALYAFGGKKFTDELAYGDVSLPDATKVFYVLPPNSASPTMIIQKRPKNQPTWDDLVRFKTISDEGRALVEKIIAQESNLLSVGMVGSGKTTILNSICSLIPKTDRVVSVEQSKSIYLEHPRYVALEVDHQRKQTMLELVKNVAFRLREDWLIVHTLEGAESAEVINCARAGYLVIAAMEGESPQDALHRLELMVLMANYGLNIENIRLLIVESFPYILQQERLPSGERVITSITKLADLKDGRYILQPLFSYDTEKKEFSLTNFGKEELRA